MTTEILTLIYVGIGIALVFIALGTTRRWFSSSKTPSTSAVYSQQAVESEAPSEPVELPQQQETNITAAPEPSATFQPIIQAAPEISDAGHEDIPHAVQVETNISPANIVPAAAPIEAVTAQSVAIVTPTSEPIVHSKPKKSRRPAGSRTRHRAKVHRGAAA